MRESGLFEPVALCDVDEQRLAAAGEQYGIDRLYTDVVELVEREDVDFVDVLTPPGPRADVVEGAVAAGAEYLLVEKPIALQPRDTERIRELGGRAFIAVNTQYQWMPHWRRLWPRLAA